MILNLTDKDISIFSLGYLTAIFDKILILNHPMTLKEQHVAVATITCLSNFLTSMGYDVNRYMDQFNDSRILQLDSLTTFMMNKLNAEDINTLV